MLGDKVTVLHRPCSRILGRLIRSAPENAMLSGGGTTGKPVVNYGRSLGSSSGGEGTTIRRVTFSPRHLISGLN